MPPNISETIECITMEFSLNLRLNIEGQQDKVYIGPRDTLFNENFE